MVDVKLNDKQRRRVGYRKRESACAGKERGRARADSHRGVTGVPRRLLLRGKVASNIKEEYYSSPTASVQGLERHHPIIEHAMGTRIPGQKKERENNTTVNTFYIKNIPVHNSKSKFYTGIFNL